MGVTQVSNEPRASERLLNRLWEIAHRPFILTILLVAAIVHLVATFGRLPERATQTDFSVYYSSALVLRHGGNPYVTDLTQVARRLGLDVGPLIRDDSMPFFLLCFEPLTYLGPKTAYWVWFGVNCVAFFAAIAIMLQGLGREWILLGALMLLYEPVAEHFAYARTEILILLMLVLMLRWLETGREARAGVILALAAALRAFPLLMVGYLILSRRWKVIYYTIAGLVITGFVTVTILGPSLCVSFAKGAIFSSQYQFAAMFLDISLTAFVSRLFWYPLGPNLGHTMELLRVIAVIFAAFAVLAMTIRATLAPSASNSGRAFSLWVVASVLLSPIAWVHYMVLVLMVIPQLALAARAQLCSERAIWAMLASYLLLKVPNDLIEIARRHHRPALFFGIGEIYFVTLILAYMSAYWLTVDYSALAAADGISKPVMNREPVRSRSAAEFAAL